MPTVHTRPCTVVYTECPPPEHLPQFLERTIARVDSFAQQRVKVKGYIAKPVVRELLEQLVQSNTRPASQVGRLLATHRSTSPPAIKLVRSEQVNRKRRLITACIQNQQTLNLKQIARHTKSCYLTVQRVYHDLRNGLLPDTYEYNNQKDSQETAKLLQDIEEADGGLMTVTDLKRLNPTFSRKKILKMLHCNNLRWTRLPVAAPANPRFAPPSKTDVNRVISQVAAVHQDADSEMLFIDEMKFPLLQTAQHHWIHKDAKSDITFNRREVESQTLTAIALCSKRQFVAVQLFHGEVKGTDFLNFLNQAIASLPPHKKYMVLADNATWHNANVVQGAPVFKFLYFNVPRMFQLNLIENAFSAVRAEFRRRPLVHDIREEAALIVRIFLSPDNTKRFQGYARNHFRMLLKYFSERF
jgi:DDE superfamily endonuclease